MTTTSTGPPSEQVDGYLRDSARRVDEEIEAVIGSEIDDAWIGGVIRYHLGTWTSCFP